MHRLRGGRSVKKLGIHPLCKLTACLRYVTYGDAYNREDENLYIGATTLKVLVRQFTKLMVQEFGNQYTNRSPSKGKREAISSYMTSKGFPACIS